MSDLLGRAGELAAVERWTASGGRLLTIAGPPGVGKSRLGREVALARPGSVVCELTSCRTAADVERALLVALGGPSRARLPRALAAHAGLVVLDRFEHLLGVARPLVASWLGAPGPSFVVTSREPLGLAGETLLALGALDGPAAVALYAARAGRDVDPALASAIVTGLDRLPLAIELAAARASVSSDRDLLARLARGIGAIDGPEASLRRAVLWSLELLGEGERTTLARCSVFRGGFDVVAAEAVTGEDVAAHLVALERKGLLRRVGPAMVAPYDAVREVAQGELARSGALDGATQAHARFHVRLAEDALASGDAAPLAGRAADLAAAHAVLGDRDPAAAATLALALDALHGAHAPSAGHVDLLSSAVLCAARAGDEVLEARALHARARAHRLLGAARSATADLRRALALARRAGSVGVEADVLRLLGVVCRQRSRPLRARRVLEHALALYERIGRRQGAAVVLDDLGVVAHDLGEIVAARESYERALALARLVGDRRFEGITLGHLGLVAHDLGDVALAQRHYREALALHRASDDRRFEGFAWAFLAAAEIEHGDLDAARRSVGAASAIDARLGDVDSGAFLAGLECVVAAAAGDIVGARGVLARAIRDLDARDDDALRRMLDVFAASIAIAEARRARTEGRADDEAAHLVAARRAISLGAVATSTEERFARRVVGHLLDAFAGMTPAVTVAADGTAFEAGSGRVSLATRRSLARMLARLAEGRRTSPGRSVTIEALFEAGWPGERVAAASARRRVYVGVDTLRSLGLRTAIVQRDRGYLLDASVEVLNDL